MNTTVAFLCLIYWTLMGLLNYKMYRKDKSRTTLAMLCLDIILAILSIAELIL